MELNTVNAPLSIRVAKRVIARLQSGDEFRDMSVHCWHPPTDDFVVANLGQPLAKLLRETVETVVLPVLPVTAEKFLGRLSLFGRISDQLPARSQLPAIRLLSECTPLFEVRQLLVEWFHSSSTSA